MVQKTTPEKIRAGKGKSKEDSSAASILAGDSLYIQRAREAFPILVRQAIARQELVYSALADEMGMPNPRNLNYVLGAIGNAIKELSVEWGEDIPPLQCVVVNKFTGLPGEGVAWFITDFKDFKNQSAEQKKLLVGVELTRIFTYPEWDKVLAAFGLQAPKPVYGELLFRQATWHATLLHPFLYLLIPNALLSLARHNYKREAA
jgi:hypothetical protein